MRLVLGPVEKFQVFVWQISLLLILVCLSLSPSFGAAGDVVWGTSLGDRSNADPVLNPEGDALYAMQNNGKLHKVDPLTGSIQWTANLGPSGHSAVEPVVASDGTIYASAVRNEKVTALNPDGSIKWRFNTDARVDGAMALGTDQVLYFADRDGNVYALKQDGTVEWKRQFPSADFKSPVAIGSDGTLYVGDRKGGNLYALQANGELKWTFDDGGRIDSIKSPTTIGRQGRIYVAARDNGTLYALDKTGVKQWEFKTDGRFRRQAVSIGPDGTLYIGNQNGKLYALTSDGKQKWAFQPNGSVEWSLPLVSQQGVVYFGSSGGYFYAVTSDGKEKWKFRLPINPVDLSGAVLKQNGYLYFTTDHKWKGFLIALETDSEKLAESPWPKFQHDNQNTGRAKQDSCNLTPEYKIRPKRAKLNSGNLTLFVEGFEEKGTDLSELQPSSVTLSGAEPERWVMNPRGLQLKYRRNDLEVTGTKGRGWTEKNLLLQGDLASSGCFETTISLDVK